MIGPWRALLAEAGHRQYGVVVHQIVMSAEALEAAAARDSRRRILENLDPAASLTSSSTSSTGSWRRAQQWRSVRTRDRRAVNDVSRAIRAAGGVNVFLRMNLSTDAHTTWRSFSDRLGDPALPNGSAPPSLQAAKLRALGRPRHLTGDLIVDKTRFGAFGSWRFRSASAASRRAISTRSSSADDDERLLRVDRRDAMQMDYSVLFLADATGRALTTRTTPHSTTWHRFLAPFFGRRNYWTLSPELFK